MTRRHDHGFSLVELLITIVILGILATVTTMAVRGTGDEAKYAACDTTRHTLLIASEAYLALAESYPLDQAELVEAGLIRHVSPDWYFALNGQQFYVVATGNCL